MNRLKLWFLVIINIRFYIPIGKPCKGTYKIVKFNNENITIIEDIDDVLTK